jgi:hypothetical protein
VFYGSGAPPGDTADLIIEEGVKVLVTTKPTKDVRPHSVMWMATVRGVVTAISGSQKTIAIRVVPEDWKVLETW